MKTATMDEHRLAARINLVDEHLRAENNHELDGTMATLNEAPLFKLNNDEISGGDGVRKFYADLFRIRLFNPVLLRMSSGGQTWWPWTREEASSEGLDGAAKK
jgi:hypothetical protein